MSLCQVVLDESVCQCQVVFDEPVCQCQGVLDEPVYQCQVVLDEPVCQCQVVFDEPLKDILHKFVSAHIKEHLQYVLENVTVDGGQQPRLDVPTRDVRAQLYARIGVKNAVHSTPHNGSSSSEDTDGESEDEDSEEEGEEADMLIPISQQGLIPHVDFTDLFDLLFVCNALSAPWRTLCAYAIHLHNPVLAVLAACYHGHSTIWCLCSWLHASLSEESDKTGLDRSIKEWTLEDLTELVRVILASCRVPLLHTAFTIFQPTCELLSFLEFYLSFMQHASEEKCMGHLVRFKEACEQKHHGCDDDSVPMSWVEDMVVTIIRYCLQHVSCVSSTHTLLTLLDRANVTCSFTVPVPPVGHLHRLHELTHDTPVTLNYAVLSDYAHPHYNAVCRHSLHQLLTHQLFDVAHQFADVTGLPSDHITIQQLHSELSALQTSDMWKQLETRVAFWRKCHQLMAKDHTPPLVAAVFYQDQATGLNDDVLLAQDQATVCPTHLERGYLYQLAYDWLSRDKDGATTTPDSEQMNKMFIQLWKCKIQDCIENGKNDNSRCHLFRQGHKERTVTQESLFRCIQTPTVASVSTVQLTQQEKAALDTLLGGLLDECHIADVIRVTSCFGHVSEDLDVVTSCMKLAIGTVCVSDLTPSVKKLLAVPRLHRRHTSTSMVALPRCISTVSIGTLAALNRESDDNSGDTILSTMQLLCLRCSHGKQCCTQIIVLYKIAKVLELSLLEVVDLEQFALLRRLLATEHAHKYVHAKSFITTSGLTDPQVAGFLCDGILSALQVHAGIVAPAMTSDGTSIPLLLGNPSKKQTCGIGELVQLCGSPSVMGQRLLDSGMALLSSSGDLSHKLLWVVVELLIYAHDCHTLACNMEGICAVLHGCRSVTTSLSLADEYNLMIHLLTGIGRFSEMTYVFDMLKQKHQFELLFRKGIEREDKLKVAILDYLKRSHPADTDTLTMVSLHYMLYRQIAQALEERAQGLLSTFSTKTLVNTPDVTSKLHKALQYLSDAAETYTKEQCLRHAEHCVKQARLVALQVHLLPTRAQVLHLSPEGVKAFVTTHHKFYEAYIVCCAYSDHNYWGDAVYQQVIERADSKYLSDLRAHVPLTGSLVEDVVERYRTTSAANMTVPVHMKKLLCCCPDIQTAYRLATELGFSDTVHDLLGGERGNYLQDIIM
ncbi:Spatacsin [Lamellibrachia satsuma]|nr:Spatacsin [Lamellibrachia satsuma]